MKRTPAAAWLWMAAFFVAALAIAPAAFAQDACRFPACNMPGETFNPTTGNCHSSAGPPTFALSHRIPTCRTDETLDRATGMCALNACGGGSGCAVRALCPAGWTYSRSERDAAGGAYGVCESGPNWLGHRSHQIVRCAAGETLSAGRGVCVGSCRAATPVPMPRPDLVIRRAFLRQVGGGPVVTSVRRGQPYWACFEVANIGTVASGAFQVGGGGLGVPTAPFQAHATLARGASRVGCLAYPTTPAVGSYRLGLTADSRTVVTETREDNNAATVPVTVVP